MNIDGGGRTIIIVALLGVAFLVGMGLFGYLGYRLIANRGAQPADHLVVAPQSVTPPAETFTPTPTLEPSPVPTTVSTGAASPTRSAATGGVPTIARFTSTPPAPKSPTATEPTATAPGPSPTPTAEPSTPTAVRPTPTVGGTGGRTGTNRSGSGRPSTGDALPQTGVGLAAPFVSVMLGSIAAAAHWLRRQRFA